MSSTLSITIAMQSTELSIRQRPQETIANDEYIDIPSSSSSTTTDGDDPPTRYDSATSYIPTIKITKPSPPPRPIPQASQRPSNFIRADGRPPIILRLSTNTDGYRSQMILNELERHTDKDSIPGLQVMLDKVNTMMDQPWSHLRCYYDVAQYRRSPSSPIAWPFLEVTKGRVTLRALEFTRTYVKAFERCGGDEFVVWNQRSKRYEKLDGIVFALLDDCLEKGCEEKEMVVFEEWTRPGIWDCVREVNEMKDDEFEVRDEKGRCVLRWACV